MTGNSGGPDSLRPGWPHDRRKYMWIISRDTCVCVLSLISTYYIDVFYSPPPPRIIHEGRNLVLLGFVSFVLWVFSFPCHTKVCSLLPWGNDIGCSHLTTTSNAEEEVVLSPSGWSVDIPWALGTFQKTEALQRNNSWGSFSLFRGHSGNLSTLRSHSSNLPFTASLTDLSSKVTMWRHFHHQWNYGFLYTLWRIKLFFIVHLCMCMMCLCVCMCTSAWACTCVNML